MNKFRREINEREILFLRAQVDSLIPKIRIRIEVKYYLGI